MRTHALAGAALVLAIAGAMAPVAYAGAATTDTCVVYSEVSHKDSQTLDVQLSNTCSKPMACSVGWTIKCGKTASVVRNGAVLDATGARSWVASAESCTEDWSIDTTWSCKPGK
jgi:hypothetical protein